jgi:hypothetical protein
MHRESVSLDSDDTPLDKRSFIGKSNDEERDESRGLKPGESFEELKFILEREKLLRTGNKPIFACGFDRFVSVLT